MQTYRIEKFGDVDGLKLRQEPDPAPGANEVVIRMRANALNFRDLNVLRGQYRTTPRANVVPLSDGAGEIVAVGAAVTRAKVGDRVAGIFFQRWIGGHIEAEHMGSDLGGSLDGMLTELKALDERGIVKIPAHLSYEEAATLPCAGVTAWASLTHYASVTAGDTVLTMGTGGVSIFALQFAKLLGARVIATTSTDEKARRLVELGADAVINYRTHTDWYREVRRLTDGRGVDLVVEVGGSGTLAQSIKSAGMNGTVVMVGRLTAGDQGIDPQLMRGKAMRLQTTSVGSRQSFEAMNRAIELHKMRPLVDRVFRFSDAASAYMHLREQRHFGKVVIASV
jgi:NADPH:quinone reductase-like Zn-dependent oxidoreductase